VPLDEQYPNHSISASSSSPILPLTLSTTLSVSTLSSSPRTDHNIGNSVSATTFHPSYYIATEERQGLRVDLNSSCHGIGGITVVMGISVHNDETKQLV
jgi:hypothetical protein